MTNPMTPIEQDDELLDKLEEVVGYLCCDFTPENTNEYSYSQQCKWCGNTRASQAHRLKNELMQLITTDRKRVALEARIELIDSMLNSNPGILHDCGRRLDGVFGKTYLEYSKSELKAQQEEV